MNFASGMEFEISLDNLRFHAYHGVFPQENMVGNEFVVDLSIRIPVPENAGEDDPESTISYADMFNIVAEEMKQPRKLMETVAERIRWRLVRDFPQIISGNIKICKSVPPIANISGSASVRIIF